MVAGIPFGRAFHGFAPPFQPDRAQHRFAHRLGNPRQFRVQGVEREQARTQGCGREQRGKIAVEIGGTHRNGQAICQTGIHLKRSIHLK